MSSHTIGSAITPPDSVPTTPSTTNYTSSPFESTGTLASAPPPDVPKSYSHKLLAAPDAILARLSTLSFPPAIAAARMAIVSMMSHSITWGQIRILTADQGIYTFPSAQKLEELGLDSVPQDQVADIRVINDTFWFRLVVLADIGFAEAYMAGDCEVSDLVQIFKVRRLKTPWIPSPQADVMVRCFFR
jgi:hypothetical protein